MGPVTHSLTSCRSDPPFTLEATLASAHTPSLPCWTVGDSAAGGGARAAPPLQVTVTAGATWSQGIGLNGAAVGAR